MRWMLVGGVSPPPLVPGGTDCLVEKAWRLKEIFQEGNLGAVCVFQGKRSHQLEGKRNRCLSLPTDSPAAFLLITAFPLATLFKAFKPKLIQLLPTVWSNTTPCIYGGVCLRAFPVLRVFPPTTSLGDQKWEQTEEGFILKDFKFLETVRKSKETKASNISSEFWRRERLRGRETKRRVTPVPPTPTILKSSSTERFVFVFCLVFKSLH